MKKTIVLLFLLSSITSAYNTTNQDAKFDQINEKITALQNELQQLRDEQKQIKIEQQQHNDDINMLSDYTEEVETKILEDKLKFGLRFKINLDNFNKKFADGHTVQTNNVWSSKLMLKMKAQITKNMNFYGRLSMYNYWGNSKVHPFSYYNNMQGRSPASTVLFVERAYLNWFFLQDTTLPLALTIGRQPSSDGPSNQFKDNSTRKGTYSALLYDGAADGIVLTADISKLIHNPKSYLRFGYAKGYEYTEYGYNVGNAFVGPADNSLNDTNIFGLFFDTTLPNVERSLVQISYSRMFDIIANPLDTNTTQNTNIGDVDLYGAMIELRNFKDTHIDLFTHLGCSVSHPNGNGYTNYGGLLSKAGDTSTKTGESIWVGGRYGFGEKQKYKIGAEFNYGSKNWINLTQGSFDVYNKLSTRGSAYEAYGMYVINRYANLRLGYIYIDYDYTGSAWFVGESKKINASISNAAYTLDTLSSIYLKMNINF
jgi:hypothetical protein